MRSQNLTLMAKKNSEHDEEVIVDVVESYNKTQQYLLDNQRQLTIFGGLLVLIIGGYFGFTKLYMEPLEAEAREQMWKAEQYFEKDSLDLAIYGDGNYYGFEAIIDNYSMTESANLAKYYLGVIHYKKGEFEIALSHLEDFYSEDVMVSSVAKGLIGDCYVALNDYDNAVAYYLKAAKDEVNKFTTPIYLKKAAVTFETMGEYKKALKSFNEIKNKYPQSQEGRDIEKYIARVEGKM